MLFGKTRDELTLVLLVRAFKLNLLPVVHVSEDGAGFNLILERGSGAFLDEAQVDGRCHFLEHLPGFLFEIGGFFLLIDLGRLRDDFRNLFRLELAVSLLKLLPFSFLLLALLLALLLKALFVFKLFLAGFLGLLYALPNFTLFFVG